MTVTILDLLKTSLPILLLIGLKAAKKYPLYRRQKKTEEALRKGPKIQSIPLNSFEWLFIKSLSSDESTAGISMACAFLQNEFITVGNYNDRTSSYSIPFSLNIKGLYTFAVFTHRKRFDGAPGTEGVTTVCLKGEEILRQAIECMRQTKKSVGILINFKTDIEFLLDPKATKEFFKIIPDIKTVTSNKEGDRKKIEDREISRVEGFAKRADGYTVLIEKHRRFKLAIPTEIPDYLSGVMTDLENIPTLRFAYLVLNEEQENRPSFLMGLDFEDHSGGSNFEAVLDQTIQHLHKGLKGYAEHVDFIQLKDGNQASNYIRINAVPFYTRTDLRKHNLTRIVQW